MPHLHRSVLSIYQDCFKLKRAEKLLILADESHIDLATRFHKTAIQSQFQALLSVIPDALLDQAAFQQNLMPLFSSVTAAVMITEQSLSHTRMRRRACKNGCRIASLPGINEQILLRSMTGQYDSVRRLSRKLADILTIGRSGTLNCPAGTDMTFSIARMKGFADTGVLDHPGAFSNIPFGEASTAPVPGTANGMLVFTQSFSQYGKLRSPLRITVKDGVASRVSGGEDVSHIRKMLKPYGQDGRMIAEVGIGSNSQTRLSGNTLEDEKCLGTVHVALGDNSSFGGRNQPGCHFDGVVLNPTLTIDNKLILENGNLVI